MARRLTRQNYQRPRGEQPLAPEPNHQPERGLTDGYEKRDGDSPRRATDHAGAIVTHEDFRPRIENSDRGITLNKSLAWSILGSLVGAGIFIGMNLAGLEKTSDDNKTLSRANEIRIRAIETQQARQDEKFNNILGYLTRIDARLERIEQGK